MSGLDELRAAIRERREKEDDWLRTIGDLTWENVRLEAEVQQLTDELNALKSASAGDVFGFPDTPLTPAP